MSGHGVAGSVERQYQLQQFEERRIFQRNQAVMDMLNHPTNPITADELLSLCDRKPERYGMYRGLALNLIQQAAAIRCLEPDYIFDLI